MDDLFAWPIEDLRLIRRVYDDGEVHYLIYSLRIDAVTVVEPEVADHLIQQGIVELDKLPE